MRRASLSCHDTCPDSHNSLSCHDAHPYRVCVTTVQALAAVYLKVFWAVFAVRSGLWRWVQWVRLCVQFKGGGYV